MYELLKKLVQLCEFYTKESAFIFEPIKEG